MNSTLPLSSVENGFDGLDIKGFTDQVNRLNGTEGGDSIIGGDLDDLISSLGGNDTVDGRAGNDTIIGGAGEDILTGGTGADTFVFDRDAALTSGEVDVILDFNPEEDSLAIDLNAGDRLTYDSDSGVVSINGKDFVNIGEGLDFEDVDFEAGSHGTDSGSVAVDPNDVFSIDGEISVSEGAERAINDFRNRRGLFGASESSSSTEFGGEAMDHDAAQTELPVEEDYDLL